MSILKELENFAPLQEVYFGHTKTQVERFKVPFSASRKMEYWHHLRQLQGLHESLKELYLKKSELEFKKEKELSWWPFWNKKERSLKCKRTSHELDCTRRSIKEREEELEITLQHIKESYKDLLHLKTKDLLHEEQIYWADRLARQLGIGMLAAQLGISEADLTAVISLGPEGKHEVSARLQKFLRDGNNILNGKEEQPRVQ